MSQLLLQPCPFCGGEPKIMHCGAGTYMIQCLGCKATTDDGSETRVSANWNRRSAAVSPSQGWDDEEKLTPEAAWTYLCETPDLTSPEEYPDHALITFEQLRDYMERAIPVEASDSAKEAEASFTEYFVRNYPGPNTVIYDPKWHAPKIFRAAAYAISAQAKDKSEALDDRTIVKLAWANFDEKLYGRLTYQTSPPMFPQATYDVPTYALSTFVNAVRAATPNAKQEGGA